jgi:hypothetical protein
MNKHMEAWKRSMDIQLDMQHGHAAWACSIAMEMPQGNAE